MREERLFLILMGAYNAHTNASRIQFNNLGLSDGQPKILYTLRRAPGIVQKELAEICGIRPSTLTVLLNKMEREDLIYKVSCHVSGGKKAFQIHLTEQGSEQAKRLDVVVDKLDEQGLAGFSDEETKTLFSLLKRVEKNML